MLLMLPAMLLFQNFDALWRIAVFAAVCAAIVCTLVDRGDLQRIHSRVSGMGSR
jgi:hypothetical protein